MSKLLSTDKTRSFRLYVVKGAVHNNPGDQRLESPQLRYVHHPAKFYYFQDQAGNDIIKGDIRDAAFINSIFGKSQAEEAVFSGTESDAAYCSSEDSSIGKQVLKYSKLERLRDWFLNKIMYVLLK